MMKFKCIAVSLLIIITFLDINGDIVDGSSNNDQEEKFKNVFLESGHINYTHNNYTLESDLNSFPEDSNTTLTDSDQNAREIIDGGDVMDNEKTLGVDFDELLTDEDNSGSFEKLTTKSDSEALGHYIDELKHENENDSSSYNYPNYQDGDLVADNLHYRDDVADFGESLKYDKLNSELDNTDNSAVNKNLPVYNTSVNKNSDFDATQIQEDNSDYPGIKENTFDTDLNKASNYDEAVFINQSSFEEKDTNIPNSEDVILDYEEEVSAVHVETSFNYSTESHKFEESVDSAVNDSPLYYEDDKLLTDSHNFDGNVDDIGLNQSTILNEENSYENQFPSDSDKDTFDNYIDNLESQHNVKEHNVGIDGINDDGSYNSQSNNIEDNLYDDSSSDLHNNEFGIPTESRIALNNLNKDENPVNDVNKNDMSEPYESMASEADLSSYEPLKSNHKIDDDLSALEPIDGQGYPEDTASDYQEPSDYNGREDNSDTIQPGRDATDGKDELAEGYDDLADNANDTAESYYNLTDGNDHITDVELNREDTDYGTDDPENNNLLTQTYYENAKIDVDKDIFKEVWKPEAKVDVPGQIAVGEFYQQEFEGYLGKNGLNKEDLGSSYLSVTYFLIAVLVGVVLYGGFSYRNVIFSSKKRNQNYEYKKLGELPPYSV